MTATSGSCRADEQDQAEADAYQLGAENERQRIAWWLDQGLRGPAGHLVTRQLRRDLTELRRLLLEEPDRWADAPPRNPYAS